MKSAHRRAYIQKNKAKGKNKLFFLKFLVPAVVVILLVLFFKFNTKEWNGVDKIPVVYQDVNGDVGIVVLDPSLNEITTFKIPGDTEVEVARNFGTFRIGGVWQRGIDEKMEGKLLAETVTQSLLFPVRLWTNKSTGLDDGQFSKLVSFVFAPGKTNIKMGDRIKMALFSLKIQDIGRSFIDLDKSHYLDRKILADGKPGHVINGAVSQRLTVFFTDNQIESDGVRVNIVDATGYPGVSEKMGQILEVIGGKVVSIDRKTLPEDADCVVSGENKTAVEKIAKLFTCKIGNDSTSFGLDIKIGRKFADRF